MNAFITTFRTEFCQAARISCSRLIRPKGHSDVYPIISKTGLCYPSFLLWSRISYFVYSLTDWARKFMVVIYFKEYHLQKNWKDLIRHPTIVLFSNRSWSWDWLNSCWRWTDPRNRKWHQHTKNDGGISTFSFPTIQNSAQLGKRLYIAWAWYIYGIWRIFLGNRYSNLKIQ